MESLTYSIHADEAFYRQTLGKHRFARASRRDIRAIRWFAALMVLVSLCGILLSGKDDAGVTASLLAGIALLAAPQIEWALMRGRLRQSPFLNETAAIRLDIEGIHGNSPLQKDSMLWASCTKAVEFEDGVLLYHGPAFFRWLPHAALQDGARPQDVVEFIKGRVPNYQRR